MGQQQQQQQQQQPALTQSNLMALSGGAPSFSGASLSGGPMVRQVGGGSGMVTNAVLGPNVRGAEAIDGAESFRDDLSDASGSM